MKVGSLFAEIGFKVDKTGIESFSNAIKTFQKKIKDGLKDLKEYAKAAKEISQAMRDAYIPNQSEARARYRAQTREISASARQKNANARRTNAEVRANMPALRASILERDSVTRERNSIARLWQTSQKERGLTGQHTGKYSQGIIGILRGIAGFNIGGIAGGVAGLAGFSHPIVMAITLGVKAIVSMIRWVGATIREGIRVGMAYRDYARFTGRDTTGIAGLLAATRNTTSMTPADVMSDIRGLEKSYWDMWFGQGNPRFWQMMGIRPTGNGEVDLKNILSSVYGITGGFQNKGLARSLLGQAGLSEQYITLVEDIMKENPTATFKELFAITKEQINAIEESNKIMREYDLTVGQVKAQLLKAFIDTGMLEVVRDFTDALIELMRAIHAIIEWWKGDSVVSKVLRNAWTYGNPITGVANIAKSMQTGAWGAGALEDAEKAMKASARQSTVTNNTSVNTTNNVQVASAEEAAEYTTNSAASIAEKWWGRSQNNNAYTYAGATG